MCMVLKTFKLSKNPMVHLLYLILIVTTVSNQADEELVDKGSTTKVEDLKLDDEEDPFGTMTLDLEPESTTPGDLKPEEKKLEAENDQNIKDTDSIPSNVDTRSTIINDESIKQKKNTIKAIFDRMNSKNSINQPNQNEINNIDLKENNIDVADNNIEDQKLVVEDDSPPGDLKPVEDDPFGTMTLDLEPESTTPGDLKPEEKELETENDQNIKDEITSSKKKKKKKKKKKSEIILDTQRPPQDTQDTPHPLKPINPKDLTLSSLENVEIVKLKQVDSVSEAIRKEKKRNIFKEFEPTEGNARIYCTFLGKVLKMYNKVKKRFIGQFCHAIVFGVPIILQNHRVHLSENMRDQLRDIDEHKQLSLVIVIMEFSNYKYWVHALRNNRGMKKLIIDIIHTAVQYKIDGIQFSNLHPTRETDEVNAHMMNKLIQFFEKLKLAAKEKNIDLKIGITIDMHGLSITKSFTSFKHLNSLVTWYSFKTISMVKCSSDYMTTGTSPLEGNTGFKMAINTLIEKINHNNEFDMTKLVVGIQLFPNQVDDTHPYTYEEFCSNSKSTWDNWCAAKPEDLRLKGRFLRSTPIGGLQLYYMHSDDYRATCGCYSFPLIRALLRGLIKVETPETCNFETSDNLHPYQEPL